MYADNEENPSSVSVDVFRSAESTSMLTAVLAATADNTTAAATLTGTGETILSGTDYVSVDAIAGGTQWTSLTGFRNVYVQIDYDVL